MAEYMLKLTIDDGIVVCRRIEYKKSPEIMEV